MPLTSNRLSVFGVAESGPVLIRSSRLAGKRKRPHNRNCETANRDGRIELRSALTRRSSLRSGVGAHESPDSHAPHVKPAIRLRRCRIRAGSHPAVPRTLGPDKTKSPATIADRRASSNRDGRIRTGDPLNPIQVRYRAAPRPEDGEHNRLRHRGSTHRTVRIYRGRGTA